MLCAVVLEGTKVLIHMPLSADDLISLIDEEVSRWTRVPSCPADRPRDLYGSIFKDLWYKARGLRAGSFCFIVRLYLSQPDDHAGWTAATARA